MGIYDRDYYREEPQGFFLSRPQTAVAWLVIANVAVYLLDYFFFNKALSSAPVLSETGRVVGAKPGLLAAQVEALARPWEWWQFLTYGFVHDPDSVAHIALNMFCLWMFGRDLESLYGRREFLLFYLASVVAAGFAWAIAEKLSGDATYCIGASGGVFAVLVLFALNFPKRTLLFMMVIPMPAWAAVGLMMLVTYFSAPEYVAHSAHLAGAAFAVLYYLSGLRISRLTPSGLKVRLPKSRPKLRLHEPDEDAPDLERRVDEILEKIHRLGESSLTAEERRTLEEASRRFQKRRR